MVENPHHLEVSIAHINHCLDVRVDIAKNELHILTMDCSISFFSLEMMEFVKRLLKCQET